MSEASDHALEAQCRCFKLLADLFDPDKGRYSRGYSDAKIAGDCGLSEKAVATIRERVFGALLPDPEIEIARREIDALQERITRESAALLDSLQALRVRVQRIAGGTS